MMTDTPEQSRKCSNCMWWVLPINDGYGMLGQCRGAPPNAREDGRLGVWPSTYGTGFCGSFRMKEPGQ
jgi:hypothetical protein